MEDRLKAINELLRKTGVRLSIEKRKNTFALRGTLPAKDGDGMKQARLPLGLPALECNLAVARDEAIRVWGLVDKGRFDWDDFIEKRPDATRQTIERFRVSLLAQGCTPKNWEEIRENAIKFVPVDEPLTIELLTGLVDGMPPNSKSRRRRAQYLARFAEFAGLDPKPILELKGGYSSPGPRAVPSDAEIEAALDGIPKPEWRALAWRLAIWGLRAHEVFFTDIDLNAPFEANVREGKTGPRGPVLPLHLKWAEEKPWREPLPPINKRSTDRNKVFGDRVSQGFRRAGLPFTPHCLRHAWAIRASTVYRLPLTVSARMMGHSVEVHTKQYHRWLSADETRRAWEAAQNSTKTAEVPHSTR